MARPLIDITGQRFGILTAEEYVGNGWRCVCDCGSETIRLGVDLRNGKVKSCGCRRGNIKDITNLKFGRLTAIRPTEKRSYDGIIWECICECGNTVFASQARLKSANIKSCGCLKADAMKAVGKSKRKSRIGDRFGFLTVESYDESSGRWLCRCDCGKTVLSSIRSLRKGKSFCSKKCKTLYKCKTRIGEKFGKLVLVDVFLKDDDIIGVFRCDCGEMIERDIYNVFSGNTKSCGCIRKEVITPTKALRKYAEEVYGEIESGWWPMVLNGDITDLRQENIAIINDSIATYLKRLGIYGCGEITRTAIKVHCLKKRVKDMETMVP